MINNLVVVLFLIAVTTANNVDNYLSAIGSNGVSYTRSSFNNWGSTISRTSLIKVQPTTKSQVESILRLAQSFQGDPSAGESPLRVRAIGSTHAYSDLFPDENQVLVDMSNYRRNEVDRIYHDVPTFSRPYYIVSFNPSVTMTDLLGYLAASGMSLPSLPSIYQSTPIGLIAAGGHGMSWSDGPIASYITTVELINAQGDYRQFDVTQNADVFNLFRFHLGLCGIFIQLTIRVIPYQLMSKYYNVEFPIQSIFHNITELQSIMTENHSWLATWKLFSSLSTAEVNNMAINGGITTSWDPASDLVSNIIFKSMDAATPAIIQAANDKTVYNVSYTLGSGNSTNCSLIYGYYSILEQPETIVSGVYPIHTEFAFSIDETTFSQMTSVLQILQDQIKTYATSHSSLPLLNVQFAFWRHNVTCLLCHSNVADVTVNPYAASTLIFMVNFQFTSAQKTTFNSMIETIYNAWVAANLISLPHMGKYIPEVTVIRTDIVSRLSTKITQFNSLRTITQIDDIDMFTNSFLDSIVFSEKQRVVLARTGSGQSRITGSIVWTVVVTVLTIAFR